MFTPATVTREEHAQGNRCCSSSLNKNLSFLINRFWTNRLISPDNLDRRERDAPRCSSRYEVSRDIVVVPTLAISFLFYRWREWSWPSWESGNWNFNRNFYHLSLAAVHGYKHLNKQPGFADLLRSYWNSYALIATSSQPSSIPFGYIVSF